ncbi:MAG: hypothetical protein H6696_18920 [Deferribacteres bacterium]|nr:hypothetical protein [candidate division KSB1 bacterium]MCB9504002.1 hypothetical protein [Deferribacteres bacterium]
MREQKEKGSSQDRRGQNRHRAADALFATAAPTTNGQVTRGAGKRQLTRADDDRAFYTTLRQPFGNKNGKANGRNKNAKAGSNRKRTSTNGSSTTSRRNNGRGFR